METVKLRTKSAGYYFYIDNEYDLKEEIVLEGEVFDESNINYIGSVEVKTKKKNEIHEDSCTLYTLQEPKEATLTRAKGDIIVEAIMVIKDFEKNVYGV